MVRTEHDIVSQVQSAKMDSEAADALIRQYMGFIRSETVKFLHTVPENGHEDELSIAMLAFYEAVLAYEKSRGAFLPYAARAIKNRLIDHYRTEKRHDNVISLHTPLGGEEDGGELLDTIPDTVDHAGDPGVFREAGPVRPGLFRRGGQLPPAGADLRRLPPGAGLRSDPAGVAEAGGGHG